jgi:hypothetical protein
MYEHPQFGASGSRIGTDFNISCRDRLFVDEPVACLPHPHFDNPVFYRMK